MLGVQLLGQVGDGTTANRLTPVAVSGLSSGVAAISAGANYTCALTTSGAVTCWGYNYYSQLGDLTTMTRFRPVAVSGLSFEVAAIAAGHSHTCALTASGRVTCWGYNGNGQLGDESKTDRLTPVTVSGLASGVASIAVGVDHSCALTTSGGVMCWGFNAQGQLGDGTAVDRLTPVSIQPGY